jgi:hypothetical protein
MRKEPVLWKMIAWEAGGENFGTADIGGKDFLNDSREIVEDGGFVSDDADVV